MRTAVNCLVACCLFVVLAGCGMGEETPPSSSEREKPDVEYDLPDGANPFEPGALVGESVASFPDTGLVNQFGEPVSFQQLPERPVAISFIYTRCPNPQMCPLITLKMKRLQQRLEQESSDPVQFVLVTFDPSHDTPAVLKNYADKRNLDYSNFELWTGDPETIGSMVSRFKIHLMGNVDSANMNHNMRLYLLDHQRVVRYYWRGTDWEVSDVASRLRDLRAS